MPTRVRDQIQPIRVGPSRPYINMSGVRYTERIRKEYPRAYERAPEKTYPHVMAELLMSERRDLGPGFNSAS